LRLKMQKVMQNNCAVFRTGEVLDEGQKLIHEVLCRHDRSACQRPFAGLEIPTWSRRWSSTI